MTGDDFAARARRLYERAKAARDRYTWDKRPIPWTAWRAAELWKLVPDEFKHQVTISAAVVIEPGGGRRPVVAANFDGVLDGPVADSVEAAGETPVHLDDPDELMDAEARIITWAERTGCRVEHIGASRPACRPCIRKIEAHGARLTTPSKRDGGPTKGDGYTPPSTPSQGPRGPRHGH